MNALAVKIQQHEEDKVAEYLQTGDPAIKDQIIEDYSRYVYHIAHRLIIPSHAVVDRQDLYQCGIIGLLYALEKFDPSRGVKFKTFAYPRIRGEMLDVLQREGCLTRLMREKLNKIEKAVSKLYHSLLREPSVDEICAAVGMDGEEYYRVTDAAGLIYSARKSSVEDNLAHIMEDENSRPDNILLNKSLKKLVKTAIKQLPERESLILSLYFMEDLTLRQIGEVLNLTEARVSQLLNQTIFRIRTTIEGIEQFTNSGVMDDH
ncbi:MAG: sigma-70 family RNA polymerase sigma factor [Calditrichia bacterium]